MIVISGIRTGIMEGFSHAAERAAAELGVSREKVKGSHVVKTSVDARRRGNISLVWSVGLELGSRGEEAAAVANCKKQTVTLHDPQPYRVPHGTEPLEHRPVIAGFGPAGMFAGLLLAREGYRPLILERGGPVERRVAAVERFWREGVLDTDTNVQFGEGGAGTFSDGKLTTRIHDPRCEFVLREFVRFGAPDEILYKAKPHIGTDLLRGIVRSIRREILALGGEIRFDTRLEDILCSTGRLCGVAAAGAEIPAEVLILAVGHSARDTFALLMKKQMELVVKPFSVGVRIEHLQGVIDRGLFGEFAGHPALGKGEYQLSHRQGDRAVYTFCMCPGGVVVPAASEESAVVVNGMSEYARDGRNANSALVVSVDGRDFGGRPEDAIAFQRGLEQAAYRMGGGGYRAPAQTVGGFINGRAELRLGRVEPTYAAGVEPAGLHTLFPPQITDMLRTGLLVFDRKLHGFACKDAVLTGVETRTSSPVRILRGEDGQAVSLPGVYPCGEGAGYAGGIMSAAVDGLRIAESVIARYRPGKG